MNILNLQPSPRDATVVFIATPHRGTQLASSWIGRLAARLIHMPELVSEVQRSVLEVATADRAALLLATIPNSIKTLSPIIGC
jgi:hypothetical protein